MKLAIMQPYLFPYIGYFQLIYASDLFLILDDVAYIKQGYINRNSVLTPNGTIRFTVPVLSVSQNKLISDLRFSTHVGKVLKTIQQSYSKAPFFEDVFPLIREVLEHSDRSIASVCLKSYQAIFCYLGIKKQFIKTSELDYDRTVSAQNRLIVLCHKYEAECYINASRGRVLYNKSYFAEQGVELKFIESLPVVYPQSHRPFVPNLSIIDLLMNCSAQDMVGLMAQYKLN